MAKITRVEALMVDLKPKVKRTMWSMHSVELYRARSLRPRSPDHTLKVPVGVLPGLPFAPVPDDI